MCRPLGVSYCTCLTGMWSQYVHSSRAAGFVGGTRERNIDLIPEPPPAVYNCIACRTASLGALQDHELRQARLAGTCRRPVAGPAEPAASERTVGCAAHCRRGTAPNAASARPTTRGTAGSGSLRRIATDPRPDTLLPTLRAAPDDAGDAVGTVVKRSSTAICRTSRGEAKESSPRHCTLVGACACSARKKRKRQNGDSGIEPRASSTLRRNHTTRPRTQHQLARPEPLFRAGALVTNHPSPLS